MSPATRPVGGEIDDAVVDEQCLLDRGLARISAEMDVACRHAKCCSNRFQFIGGVFQPRQCLRKSCAIDSGTLQEVGCGCPEVRVWALR